VAVADEDELLGRRCEARVRDAGGEDVLPDGVARARVEEADALALASAVIVPRSTARAQLRWMPAFLKDLGIAVGINNLFDKEPPLAPGMQDNDYGTGFYGTYDPLGRYVFSGIQFNF